jgi:hypothetical protein
LHASGQTLAEQIGIAREDSKANRIRSVASFRAKEAFAAKTKMEQELQALALQLETAVARAQKCEENERTAEDVASRHKVSHIVAIHMGSMTLSGILLKFPLGCCFRSCS